MKVAYPPETKKCEIDDEELLAKSSKFNEQLKRIKSVLGNCHSQKSTESQSSRPSTSQSGPN